MTKKLLGIATILFILLFPVSSFSSTFSRPPATIKLKLPPPKTESEALKKIPDFIILNTILPPVIDRKKLMEQLFGNFTYEVKKVLTKEKIKELSLFTTSKLKSGKVKLSELRKLILNKLNIKLKTSKHSFNLSLPVLIGVVVSIIISVTAMLILFIFPN